MDDIFTRIRPLVTEEGVARLKDARVAVIGLGGVGGIALECLVRSGVGHVFIADHDIVEPSNLNRQIIYTTADLGQGKTQAAIKRMQAINPDIDIIGHHVFINEDTAALLVEYKPDFVIDAIDSIKGKAALIKLCQDNGIPIVVSLGMGNRRDPSKVMVTTLDKTSGDPLGKALKTTLKANRVSILNIPVVFSKEQPIVNSRPVASLMAVPATAGLYLATEAIDHILKGN